MPPDEEPVGKGHALWLVPEEPVLSLLAGKITGLSQKFSTPLFGPHVTLLAGITLPEAAMITRCASLADLLKPLRIELGKVGYSDDYFRCLFASVVPARPIIKAHQAAQKIFGFREAAAYVPHLSLLYGRLPLETKKEIAAAYSFLSGQTLDVLDLALYQVGGPVHEWKCAWNFDLR